MLRFSDPRSTCPSVFRPEKHPVFDFLQAILMLYRYSIDTVSILYRYSINIACKKPKTGCFSGRKTEAQVPLGSENRSIGELRGRSWVTSGGSWGDSGGSEGGQRGSPAAARGRKKKNHFLRFKIMKLCRNLNLLLKRLEVD